MERKGGLLFLVFVVLALSAANTNATIVTIGLTGEVAYVDERSSILQELFHVGDPVSGIYVYDTETPDTNPFPAVGDYVHSGLPYGIFLNVAGLSIQSVSDNARFVIEILDNHTGLDGHLIISYTNLPLPNGLPVWDISWQLVDYSQTAVSSTRLLETGPVLEDWQYNRGLSIHFGSRGGLAVGVEITSVEFVPDPSTFFLLFIGSAALLATRKR